MSTSEVETYVQCLLQSGLVSKEQVTETLSGIVDEASSEHVDMEEVAQQFVNAGLVTPWQNEKLLKGRYKGFVLGNYKLLNHIATGGMSNIYLGEHKIMRRRVAIKVLPPALTENTSYLDRFYVESRAIAALDHPNIVRAHDIAKEGSFHYMVLEYVEGRDLRDWVNEDGPLPFETAAEFIAQAAEGLQHAHSKGIIHRDVKPANLLVGEDNTIKILDMGLTRFSDSGEPSLTLAYNEKLVGTVDYIAPEQAANSHDVDSRADIYSLGCTFYFILTGQTPFPDGSQSQRLMAHQFEEPTGIAELRPDTPKELVQICQRMMEKKPEDRFQTADEVSRALKHWLKQTGGGSSIIRAAAAEEELLEAGSDAQGSSDDDSAHELSWEDQETTISADEDSSERVDAVELEARRQALDAREARLNSRDSELKVFHERLERRADMLDRRAEETTKARQKLKDLENFLESKSANLEHQTEKMEVTRKRLGELEHFIEMKAKDLEDRETKLEQREQKLRERVEMLKRDYRRFQNAVEQFKEKRDELRRKEQELGGNGPEGETETAHAETAED